MSDLFIRKEFVSAGGLNLDWKIECDSLTDTDLATLAHVAIDMLKRINRPHGRFAGVPRGGLRFAEALNRIADGNGPLVVVDDVYTTGKSITQFMAQADSEFGLVIFARSPAPMKIVSLFQTNYYMDPNDEKRLEIGW